MINSRFPTNPYRSAYQNEIPSSSKSQSYPQQTRYSSYSNTPNGYQSTWPPNISTGTSDSDSNYTHPPSTNDYRSSPIQDDDNNSIKTKQNMAKSPSCTSISSIVPEDIDSSNSSFSDSPSISNEKSSKKSKTSQTTSIDVFNKLRQMGNEPERNLFVDRLQKLWEEYHIICRKLPILSRQTIDLYRLYISIREQNGFEQFSKIAKNRHWRDIALKLNIPNCSTAAFNIKQKYLNLKLFHYECKYDRGGIDPEPILADIEKQKEKRLTKNNDGKLIQSLSEPPSTRQVDIDYQPSNRIPAAPIPR
jgi:AT-rich interactive domain-containing protein 1